MRVALDTNRYVDYCRGLPDVVEVIRRADRIFLPFVVVGELRAGFLGGTKGKENEARLVEFVNSARVDVLLADESTTHHYARLFVQLRKQGTPVPTNDLWIAALVVQHDLFLCSRDQHFEALPQLPRV